MVGVDFIVLITKYTGIQALISIRTFELNRGILGEIAKITLKVSKILNFLHNCES